MWLLFAPQGEAGDIPNYINDFQTAIGPPGPPVSWQIITKVDQVWGELGNISI